MTKEQTTVYVLLNCNEEGSNFLGVYSSKELAKKAKEEYNRKAKEAGWFLEKWDSANRIIKTTLDKLNFRF